MKTCIIIVNYNGYKDTLECINSLKENINSNYKIIVVDNKSTDDSVEKLRTIDGIYLIEADKNGGFSYGNNLGIKYALNNGYENVILLNNDTIVTKDCFDIMLEKSKSKDIGIVGNKILYYYDKNKIYSYGGNINMNRGTAILGYNLEKNQKLEDVEVKFISGCCMLIKKEVFEKIGFLNENYFMYYEDVEFCLKASEFFKLIVINDSVIYHKVSASTGGEANSFAIRYNTRNRIIFMEKYAPKAKGFFYITRIIILLKYLLKGKRQECLALIDGIKLGRKYINENK